MAEEDVTKYVDGCGIRSMRSVVMKKAWERTEGKDVSFGEFGKYISEEFAKQKKACGL